jgi:hypothetical protein
MTERDTNPTMKELLKRLDRLEKKVALFGDHLYSLSQDFMDHRAAQADRFESAFERIKNIEVSVFPNLLNDIESVHQIIGGEGVPAEKNPLDKRKITPPDGGKPPGSV